MNTLSVKKYLKNLHFLSLDVVAGAMICNAAFGKLPNGNGKPDAVTVLMVGTCTWLLYILDRLLDLRIYPKDHTARHEFHAKYQYNLQLVLVGLAVINAFLVFFLPKPVLYYGIGLSVGVGGYFWALNRYFRDSTAQWIKEPTTAICYTLAVAGTAIAGMSAVTLSTWLLAGLFFFVAMQNLLLFSYFESREMPESRNIVHTLGESATRRLIFGCNGFVVFIALLFFSGSATYAVAWGWALVAMSSVLSFLLAVPQWAATESRYRWLGDGVFLLPLWLLFW